MTNELPYGTLQSIADARADELDDLSYDLLPAGIDHDDEDAEETAWEAINIRLSTELLVIEWGVERWIESGRPMMTPFDSLRAAIETARNSLND